MSDTGTTIYFVGGEQRRYCRSCVQMKPLDGGSIVIPRSPRAVAYWRCGSCNERRSPRQLTKRNRIERTA